MDHTRCHESAYPNITPVDCSLHDTLILTQDYTWKKVQDVQKGDIVKKSLQNMQRSQRVQSIISNMGMVEFYVDGWERPVMSVTQDHPMYICSQNRRSSKRRYEDWMELFECKKVAIAKKRDWMMINDIPHQLSRTLADLTATSIYSVYVSETNTCNVKMAP